ncbi:metallophosphoesterase family protein [Hyphococcus flavus]|uniref:Metallophosphoesterase family protein n=1 Tax=Hyphococcus flavus TaxID=1866326 RepID=A0AAE9Z9U5_9PROT|nr:metallophosphoesterase family protein [Hyphococcus flavus]WDI30068.1 metallophosphoesterase family protein [Hyphococcus flavus]
MFENFFNKKGDPAAAPEGKRLYAIGDVHGRLDLLDALLDEIEKDASGLDAAKLIFLGDYVDRGEHSRGVIDRLVELKHSKSETVFLKGNHEASMLDFLDHPDDLPHWLDWGGLETLESYGVDTSLANEVLANELRKNMPATHHKFLQTLKLNHIEGDYLFVHAGLRPGTPLEEQTEEDMLWIRTRFHNAPKNERPEYVVVHGHTPEERPIDDGWRINVDTGACYGGPLTAVVLEGTQRWFLSVRF